MLVVTALLVALRIALKPLAIPLGPQMYIQTPMLATALNKAIGYDKAAEIVKKALKEKKTLKQAALELGYLTEEEFDRIVVPMRLAKPHEGA